MAKELGVSERKACYVIGKHRSTQRKILRGNPDEKALTKAIISLAEEYGHYGFHRITALLRRNVWSVNDNSVYQFWRHEAQKVPQKQPEHGGL